MRGDGPEPELIHHCLLSSEQREHGHVLSDEKKQWKKSSEELPLINNLGWD